MKRIALTLVLAGFVVLDAPTAWAAKAKDIVYFREPGQKKDTDVAGAIQEESPAGIKLKTAKGEDIDIPALQIRAVDYAAGLDALGKVDYHVGDSKLINALRETRADKKADALRTALLAFHALDDNEKLSGVATIHRYFQFRIAQTLTFLAREDASQRDAALNALTQYKANFADGWEIVPALQLLASLQEDKGDTEAASQTLADLAEVPGVTAAVKLQSQLKGARLLMAIHKFADAESKLKQVEAGLSADDPQRAFVSAYLIQSRIAQKGNLDGLDKKLQQILRTGKDGNLLALAHNSLGDYYRAKGDLVRAFWEYCKVDMLYNQDKEEHAKALYYLSQLFDRPRNEPRRAEACLTRLKSPQFDGTLYQRQAMAEKKSGQ